MVAVATVAVGLWRDGHGTQLGVPHPPFIGAYGIRATWWLIPTVPAFVAAVALVRPVLKLRGVRFALSIFVGTLILRVLLGAVRQGTFGWHDMFDVLPRGEGKNEYLPSLAAFDYGARFFLDRFSELVPALPVHSAGHPPGLLLVMHYAHIDTANRLAWFCILVGALLGAADLRARRGACSTSRVARIAGVLAALSPAMLHFGATSADAVYLTLGLLAAIGLLRKPWLGAAILAVVTLFAWSLLAVAAWAAILVLLRDGFKAALKLSIACAVATIAFQGGARARAPAGTRSARCRPRARSTSSASPRGARTRSGCSARPRRSC